MCKTHLRKNTAENAARIGSIAACASNAHTGRGRNGRSTYQLMSSPIVGFADFKATPEADRCAHCVEAALIIRNRQRRDKGLAPVARFDD